MDRNQIRSLTVALTDPNFYKELDGFFEELSPLNELLKKFIEWDADMYDVWAERFKENRWGNEGIKAFVGEDKAPHRLLLEKLLEKL